MTSFAAGLPRSIRHQATRLLAEAERLQPRIVTALGIAATVAALGFMLERVSHGGSAALVGLVSSGFWFWAALIASVLVEPLADSFVLRRLLGTGGETLIPLLRKQAFNTLLVSYAGDTLFMGWLRARIGDARAAFAVVVNMAVVSAFVNNIITLTLLVIIWQPIQPIIGGRVGDWPMLIAAALAALPLVLMVWRCRAMAGDELGLLVGVLGVRTIIHAVLIAAAWHFALPQVPLLSLLLLTTGRMVVSRLPIVPNKDIAFAGLVALLLGPNEAIVPVIAGVALLTLIGEGLGMMLPAMGTFRRPKTALAGQ